ncbi:hypothetical protein G6011_05373 [Alternaria panax]|uniref:C2H2-type domain-containing protein n=1 Tax=Alternaria panax TaxID=48097 RepID=A0AAD4FCW8_9PLEO|nr:hypothetical protein G6011_05373 [Alternaria panax]
MPPNNTTTTTTPRSILCNQCTRSFVKATALAAHRRSEHPIPCTFEGCMRTFPSQKALKQHSNSSVHANKRSNPVQSLSKGSKEFSPQVGRSEDRPKTLHTTGTIAETNTEFATKVVVEKTSRTLDPLAAHFESSLHISTLPRPTVQSSSSSPRVSTAVVHSRERAIDGTTPGNRTSIRPNVQESNSQPAHKKTVIPLYLQNAAFIALTTSCHSRATLVAKKFTFNTDRTRIIKDAEALMHYALPTPKNICCLPKHAAIALNCDVVRQGYNESEISHISAIDYLTGEIIIDAPVQPIRPVENWHTNQNRQSKEGIAAATAVGTILNGWPDARAEIWKNIDADTILLGHNLHRDLTLLRMEHCHVVDSAILAPEAVGHSIKRCWSLRALCSQLLDVQIQSDKKEQHHCVEDAFAKRELILWWTQHPVEVSEWATNQQQAWHRRVKHTYNKRRTNLPNPDDWIWPVLASMDYNPFSG